MRFSRDQRIRTRREFDTVRHEGKQLPGRYFRLQVLEREGATDHSRLGMAVSRKVGNAVIRNKVKRRFREIFRLSCESFRCHLDIVIIALPNSKEASYHTLRGEFTKRTRGWQRLDDTQNG